MEVRQKSDMVLEVRHEYRPGDTFQFLLVSDVHLDHPDCDRKTFFRLMDNAKDRGAGIFINGDLLCLMQGRHDRRGDKGAVRAQHWGVNYFDLVIKESAELLAPYAKHIILVGDGNHETAIVKHNEFNPLDILVHRLNSEHGGNIMRGGYHGYIVFAFHDRGSRVRRHIMYRHHGKFGGIVSKGVQGVARHGLVVPDADSVWTGHTHDLTLNMQPRMRMKKNGEVVVEDQVHIKTGTFKDEFTKPGGFGVEKIAVPKSVGGWWVKMKIQANKAADLDFFAEVAR